MWCRLQYETELLVVSSHHKNTNTYVHQQKRSRDRGVQYPGGDILQRSILVRKNVRVSGSDRAHIGSLVRDTKKSDTPVCVCVCVCPELTACACFQQLGNVSSWNHFVKDKLIHTFLLPFWDQHCDVSIKNSFWFQSFWMLIPWSRIPQRTIQSSL